MQYPAGIDLTDPLDLATLPQTEAVCARLLSGDANNDGAPDEPSLDALWQAIYGNSPVPLPAQPPVGFPTFGTGAQG